MTLSKAVDRLRAILKVDLEADVDLDNNETATEELMTAAQEFFRDAYVHWVMQSALTLSVKTGVDAGRFDTLTECADRIFHPYGVHINGQWLVKLSLPEFELLVPDYHNETAGANPGFWCHSKPQEIRVSVPPNATAVAATDNFVRGFAEHPVWDYGNYKDTELLGSNSDHKLIVYKAALNNTIGTVASSEGHQRRAMIQKEYETKTMKLQVENLERVRPLKKQARAGQIRKVFGVGNSW